MRTLQLLAASALFLFPAPAFGQDSRDKRIAQVTAALAEVEPGTWEPVGAGVSLQVPKGWNVVRTPQGEILRRVDATRVVEGILVQKHPRQPGSPEEQLASMRKNFVGEGYTILSGMLVDLGDKKAVRLSMTGKPGGNDVHQEVLSPVVGSKQILVLGNMALENEPKLGPQVRKIIDAAKPAEPSAAPAGWERAKAGDWSVDFPAKPEFSQRRAGPGGAVVVDIYKLKHTSGSFSLSTLEIEKEEGVDYNFQLAANLDGFTGQIAQLTPQDVKLAGRWIQGRPGIHYSATLIAGERKVPLDYWVVIDGQRLLQLTGTGTPEAVEAFFGTLASRK